MKENKRPLRHCQELHAYALLLNIDIHSFRWKSFSVFNYFPRNNQCISRVSPSLACFESKNVSRLSQS